MRVGSVDRVRCGGLGQMRWDSDGGGVVGRMLETVDCLAGLTPVLFWDGVFERRCLGSRQACWERQVW